ncbi:MAG: DUF4868 domain-containing protein [Candidatus Nomurabacteria bacterium]|jgi:hypothetical protein|nr:DUF4868 domain-containing protein [Candidatus Nomurabacteria bacterium]
MEKADFDIFLWANNIDEVKGEVKIELFLFNKNYTPYKIRFSNALEGQIRQLFLIDMINFVNSGANSGWSFRDYEFGESEDAIYFTELSKVGRAETLVHLIENEYKDISFFTEADHEFKRIKGIVVRFSHGEQKFYVAKGLATGQALGNNLSWVVKGESFEPFSADAGIKIPNDNQVLVVDGRVVIFNRSKFEKLFQYDFQTVQLAEQKAKEIAEKYKLSFAEGLELADLLKDKKPLVSKLEKLEIGEMTQEQVVDYADEMQLELMTDTDGSIIIMDDKDLGIFVNLLDENYYVSAVSGRRYEIRNKRLLGEPEGEPPRG